MENLIKALPEQTQMQARLNFYQTQYGRLTTQKDLEQPPEQQELFYGRPFLSIDVFNHTKEKNMRKVLLITGASEQDRGRFITYRQNTEPRELRSILPLCNEYILDDIENGWQYDLCLSVQDDSLLSPEVMDKVTERVVIEKENGKIFFTETSGSGHRRKELQDKEVFPSWSAVINTHIVVIGNSDDGRTVFPPELLNDEGCDAAFSFGILLSTSELHNPFAHWDSEIACRLDKLFNYRLNTVSYDPKTRTGFASISGSSPPAVGTIRCLPEDK